MSNFSFPPPPPPPPRARPDPASISSSNNDRGGRGGFRGRGRGRGYPHRGGRGGHDLGQSTRPASSYPDNPNFSGLSRGPENGSFRNGKRGDGFDSFRGQKRKRDDFGPTSRPQSRPKVDVAPAVPSFGAPLFSSVGTYAPKTVHSSPPPSVPGVREIAKRKSNPLGLTPQDDDGEQSGEGEDEDDDESLMARAAKNLLQFEYNGTKTDIGSDQAMSAWLAERKAKWPTKARVAEKKQQELKKQQDALRRKLELDKAKKQASQAQVKKKTPVDRAAKAKLSLEKHLAKAEKLRKKLEKSEAKAAANIMEHEESVSSARPSNSITRSEDMRGQRSLQPEQNPEHAESVGELPLIDSSDVPSTSSSEDDSSIDSSDSDSADSDSGAPEALRSKETKPTTPARPERNSQICRRFAAQGRCPQGNRCRFKHERKSSTKQPQQQQPMKSKRISLYQRLVEQEKESENRRALEVIKYLGQNGFLDEVDQ